MANIELSRQSQMIKKLLAPLAFIKKIKYKGYGANIKMMVPEKIMKVAKKEYLLGINY